jgi:formate dehydrogenase subunit gamma
VSGAQAALGSRTAASRGDRIMRYSFGERVNHWIAGLTYIYLLLTGLAFWSPYLFWLVILFGGGPAARFWHPWVGLVFTASVFWMHRVWRQDMQPTKEDLAWKDAIGNYIRNEDEYLPPIGRFNWGQKQFFWIMLYGTVGLALSGIAMWLINDIPWLLVRQLAILIHAISALVTIGAFIIHVYMGTAMVRGGFNSIIRGEVSTTWAKMHHRLWYEKVTRGEAGTAARK